MLTRLARAVKNPWLRGGLLVVVLAWCGYALYREWPQVTQATGRLNWHSAVLALAAGLAGGFCQMLAWRAVLADLGSPLPVRIAGRVNFIAQLGKYVPGGVWALAAQVELSHDYQIPRRRSLASVIVSLTVTVGSGLGLSVLTLPFASPDLLKRYWWLVAAAPCIVAVLCPPVLGRVIDLAFRLAKRQPLGTRPTWRGLGLALAWNLIAWLLLGMQVWLLIAGVTGANRASFLLAAGGYALAFSAGLLLVVLPGGIGIREIILIGALTQLLPHGTAVAVAVVARVISTVSDISWGTLGAAMGRQAHRPGRHAAVHRTARHAAMPTSDPTAPAP